MDDPSRAIAVVVGTSIEVQDQLRALVERWRPVLRLAGIVGEGHGIAGRVCGAGYLRRVGTDERFAMFDNRGRDPEACHLDGRGALAAAEAARQDIAAGCDLVVLSKFGRLEAAGKGLRRAFEAAIESGIPLVTSVSPAVAEKWQRFAARGVMTLEADAAVLDAWVEATAKVPPDRQLVALPVRSSR